MNTQEAVRKVINAMPEGHEFFATDLVDKVRRLSDQRPSDRYIMRAMRRCRSNRMIICINHNKGRYQAL